MNVMRDFRKAGYATPVIAALIRCTAETSTPTSLAVFTIPAPPDSSSRTAASLSAEIVDPKVKGDGA
jgi:hypothetical protein